MTVPPTPEEGRLSFGEPCQQPKSRHNRMFFGHAKTKRNGAGIRNYTAGRALSDEDNEKRKEGSMCTCSYFV